MASLCLEHLLLPCAGRSSVQRPLDPPPNKSSSRPSSAPPAAPWRHPWPPRAHEPSCRRLPDCTARPPSPWSRAPCPHEGLLEPELTSAGGQRQHHQEPKLRRRSTSDLAGCYRICLPLARIRPPVPVPDLAFLEAVAGVILAPLLPCNSCFPCIERTDEDERSPCPTSPASGWTWRGPTLPPRHFRSRRPQLACVLAKAVAVYLAWCQLDLSRPQDLYLDS